METLEQRALRIDRQTEEKLRARAEWEQPYVFPETLADGTEPEPCGPTDEEWLSAAKRLSPTNAPA